MKKSFIILGIVMSLYACGGKQEKGHPDPILNSSKRTADSAKVGSSEVAGDGVNGGVGAGTNEDPKRPGAKRSEDSLRKMETQK